MFWLGLMLVLTGILSFIYIVLSEVNFIVIFWIKEKIPIPVSYKTTRKRFEIKV